MARNRIPNALEMQDWKYGDRPEADRDALAAELRDAGRRSEALLLFDGRPGHPFVAGEVEWAAGAGSAFHLFAVRAMGGEVSDDQMRRCADAAAQRGRFLDARRCYEALGDEEAIARIADQLPERLRPGAADSAEPE